MDNRLGAPKAPQGLATEINPWSHCAPAHHVARGSDRLRSAPPPRQASGTHPDPAGLREPCGPIRKVIAGQYGLPNQPHLLCIENLRALVDNIETKEIQHCMVIRPWHLEVPLSTQGARSVPHDTKTGEDRLARFQRRGSPDKFTGE